MALGSHCPTCRRTVRLYGDIPVPYVHQAVDDEYQRQFNEDALAELAQADVFSQPPALLDELAEAAAAASPNVDDHHVPNMPNNFAPEVPLAPQPAGSPELNVPQPASGGGAPNPEPIPPPNPPYGQPAPASGEPPFTLDDLVCQHRTWRQLPHESLTKFTALARPYFLEVQTALNAGDIEATNLAVGLLLSLPQVALVKRRTGTTRRSKSQLATQIRHCTDALAFDESKNIFGPLPASEPFKLWKAQRKFFSAEAKAARAEEAKEEKEGKASGPDGDPSDPDMWDDINLNEIDDNTKRLFAKCKLAQELVSQGHVSRAVKTLTNSPLAELTPENIAALKKLHPARPADRATPPMPNSAINVETRVDLETLKKVLKKLSTGASPGPSGWTADLLLQLIADKDCAAGLLCLVNHITNDMLPPVARQYILQSWLVAVAKPNNGIRPIAMGSVFYKISCHCALAPLLPALTEFFEPLQFAIGSVAGVERAFRKLQTRLDTVGEHLTDASNAFNTENRDAMLEELYRHPQFQQLFKIATFGYGHEPTSLVCRLPKGGLIRLASEEGSRQGCVLGTILYCFAKKQPFESAIEGMPATVATAFADDFNAVGKALHLAETATRLINSGHNLNLDKTKLLWPHSSAVPDDIKQAFQTLNIEIICNKGRKVLGAFLGLPHHKNQAERFAMSQASSHKHLFNALNADFLPWHTTYYVLRFAAQPRMIYQTRLTAKSIGQAAFNYFDDRMTEVVHKLFSMRRPGSDDPNEANNRIPDPPLPASALQQTMTPCRHGGKGIRAISSLADAAYYASHIRCLADTRPIETEARQDGRLAANENSTTTNHAREAHRALIADGVRHSADDVYHLKDKNGKACLMTNAPILPTDFSKTPQFYDTVINNPAFKLQRITTHQKENAQDSARQANLSKRTRARLACLKKPGACAILNPWPSSDANPRPMLTNLEFATWMNFTSGVSPYHNLPDCPCGHHYDPSSPTSDETHAMSCKKYQGERIFLHDLLKNLATKQARRAGLAAGNEPATDMKGPRYRPDGEQLFSSGLNYTDTTTVHPLTPLRVANNQAGTKALLALAVKGKIDNFNFEGQKDVKDAAGNVIDQTRSFCALENASFLALAIETYGGLHTDYLRFLRNISAEAVNNLLCADTDPERNAYYAFLVAETQATLIKGITKCFRAHARKCRKHGHVQRVRNRSRVRARGAAVASNLGPMLEHAAKVADANVQRNVVHGPGSEQLVVHVRLEAAA
jgi:hypothetical protein